MFEVKKNPFFHLKKYKSRIHVNNSNTNRKNKEKAKKKDIKSIGLTGARTGATLEGGCGARKRRVGDTYSFSKKEIIKINSKIPTW